MTYRLTFSAPEDVTNPGMDGIKWSFPFSIIDTRFIGSTEETLKTSQHRIIVPISRSCYAPWRLSGSDVVKVLFEFGCQFLKTRLTEYSQLANYSIDHPMITTSSHEDGCPFNPARIPEPKNHAFEFELPKTAIGFHTIQHQL